MIRQEIPAKGETAPSVEDCRAQLARILNSADFGATDRKHRFLRYVVDEALAGRGNRIKAYSIAVEVFGRDASFDPQTDPIVRVEAGHLRRALERYYLTAGLDDPILIGIPKGGYVPTFSRRYSPGPVPEEPAVAAAPAPRRASLGRKPLVAAAAILFVAAAMALAWGYPFRFSPSKPEV
ncbi:MAG TPA: hypothetical protein VNS34_15590, partial [Rhizobiaceae bacterium]|nr:hypothetical protein [Rhizobiaceae bacterium]